MKGPPSRPDTGLASGPSENAVFLPEGQEMDGPLRRAIIDALPERTTFGFNSDGDQRTWMHLIGPATVVTRSHPRGTEHGPGQPEPPQV